MRDSSFVIEATKSTGLGGGGLIAFKVTAGMLVSTVKAVGAAVRWTADALRRRQKARLNTRLPLGWIQFSARHQGGAVPLSDAGMLVGVIAVLPGLLRHLDEKFLPRQFMFAGGSDRYEALDDAFHSLTKDRFSVTKSRSRPRLPSRHGTGARSQFDAFRGGETGANPKMAAARDQGSEISDPLRPG